MAKATYNISDKDLATVKSAVGVALDSSFLKTKSWAKIQWEGDDLVVKIDKLGSSEFRLEFRTDGGGVKVQEGKSSIAWAHKAFEGQAKDVLNDLLTKVGAKKNG